MIFLRPDHTECVFFFAVRGVFFALFSVGSERSARCLCALGALHFYRNAERLKLKKSNSEQKSTLHHRVFFHCPI